MDVHDTGSLSRSAVLVGGNVITIGKFNQYETLISEPGIYIPDSEDYPEKYRGIGIRIEDDVIVGGEFTESDGEPIVLTGDAPKLVNDIESIMAISSR